MARSHFRFGWVLALWGASTAVAGAADEAGFVDLRQTLQARKLLFEDGQLGSLNLGVRVERGVAVLWGPVPTAELGLRAVARLRTMIEVAQVRNELFVAPDEMPGFEPFPSPAGPLFLPDPPPPNLPKEPAFPRKIPAPFAQEKSDIARQSRRLPIPTVELGLPTIVEPGQDPMFQPAGGWRRPADWP